jgi:hypothetical protein
MQIWIRFHVGRFASRNWRYSSFRAGFANNGVVVVSTPQAVALADAKKGVSMFLSEAINVPWE